MTIAAHAGGAAGLPPGPRYARVIANYKWQSRTTDLLEEGRRYGDVWTLRLLGGAVFVFVADPELIGEVFAADPSIMHHEALLTPVVGTTSVLVLDEPAHERMRQVLAPPFDRDHAPRHRDAMARVSDEEVAAWPVGEPFSALPRVSRVVLRVVTNAVFGGGGAEREAAFRRHFGGLFGAAANPLRIVLTQQKALRGLKPPRWLTTRLGPIDALIFEEIRRARDDTDRDDVLAMLVRARQDDGTELTDRQLRDQVMTLMIQGHTSTVNAISWALERLTRTPDALERAQSEALAGGDEYLDAVVKETLRARPPLPFVMRALKQPFQLGEYELPGGTLIALNAWVVHHRPDLYPDPEAFRPERFLGRSPAPNTWIPFGGGARACIGAAFALQEIKVVLAAVLRRFRLEPTSEPAEGVKRLGVQFSPRRGARILLGDRLPD